MITTQEYLREKNRADVAEARVRELESQNEAQREATKPEVLDAIDDTEVLD